METFQLYNFYQSSDQFRQVVDLLNDESVNRVGLKGLIGSARALFGAAILDQKKGTHVFILSEKEEAAYFYNDLERIFGEKEEDFARKKILFYPTSYKRHYEIESADSSNILLRTETLNRLSGGAKKPIIVTYPEAIAERVVTRQFLNQNKLRIHQGEQVTVDFILDLLLEYGFERVDFVVEPGQFALRGGIIDVFPFSNDLPFRLEFYGNQVEGIRTFDPASQLSKYKVDKITLIPNVQEIKEKEKRIPFLQYLADSAHVWVDDLNFSIEKIAQEFEKAEHAYDQILEEDRKIPPESLFINEKEFVRDLLKHRLIEFGKRFYFSDFKEVEFHVIPQPPFNKNFELLIAKLKENKENRIKNYFFSGNPSQVERLYTIFQDMEGVDDLTGRIDFIPISIAIHEGFTDTDLGIACYTDHQIFERYHPFHLQDSYKSKQALTLKELYDLKPGDYVTHIDHGIGRFDGLEKINVQGKMQEAIRLIYKNEDLLYISIHSLHRIAKYIGKEGTPPVLNRLGSNAWKNLKAKTKKKVKDIARDLIALYAKRRASEGTLYPPDTYLQHELEASFIYEDTPDQLKATKDVKKDLEAGYPMDRLVCGDVGFGKTEIAVRAAFKVVAESKQVALLVPTTILALQHYKTFSERLANFPVQVDYINRFKSSRHQKETLKALEEGKVDILIGTHRLISKDVKFKDLGLLVIDEEQKFGVASKEKLKQLKFNVDTLTLTATPIPRTLQFSMMGARDLSIINTPPPNRYPVQTEVRSFSEDVIRDGINYEVSRGGQVFFVHNRVQNIVDVARMIQKFCPRVKIAVGHGQMEGARLEKVMLEFIDGVYDVLVSTTIIESGLDIPNVNTIFINGAQNFGLSDLHQLRGRVGRSNKKAFCYLIAPPLSTLTNEARKRLKAIEEFADLGSGFNIAMRDLDIRGAGNILGAEQSGFISEIGFEMYQKILDEAITELKENEFKEVYKEEEQKAYTKDCVIETDMALLLPDDYITNITERLSLYKELDSVETEEELMKFQDRLIDRFGPIPPQTGELINTIRLRWKAKYIGFEKLVLKNDKMVGHFIQDPESPYYQSEVFTGVLKFVQTHPQACQMRENKNRLTISMGRIKTIIHALEALDVLLVTIDIKVQGLE